MTTKQSLNAAGTIAFLVGGVGLCVAAIGWIWVDIVTQRIGLTAAAIGGIWFVVFLVLIAVTVDDK